MGGLHAGHLALVDASARANDLTVVSIFLNPLQFDDPNDLADYPRDDAGDVARLREWPVQAVFLPDLAAMWPAPARTVVSVPWLSGQLEGVSRPGHMDGVALIVTKLLSLVGECRAYFGEKDFQQLVLIRQLVADLSLPADIVSVPVVREADGLAFSTRNKRLSPKERAAALCLYGALRLADTLIASGERDPMVVSQSMAQTIQAEPLAQLEYAEVRSNAMEPVESIDGPVRLLVAARIGCSRLIDSFESTPTPGSGAQLAGREP
jgi:pantoate--beta-alanine ligase